MSTDHSNSRADSSGFLPIPKPNWGDWGRTQRCKLWEAVALASDVDPACFQPDGVTSDATQDSVLTPITGGMRHLLGLSKIAVVSGNLTTVRIDSADTMQSEVELSDFTSWLDTIGCKRPDEFPWTARTLVPGPLPWPWGRYQTKTLQIMALAVDKFWKNYDPGDSSTAPKNETVIAWLEEKGVAKRNAQVIATVLRADGLSPGPR